MYKHNNIKILVCYYNKNVDIKSRLLSQYYHILGDADNNLNLLTNNLHGDNNGDNISNLNKYLCELTSIYWAWKNQDKLNFPEYIGIEHYRRTFGEKILSEYQNYDIIHWNNIINNGITSLTLKSFFLANFGINVINIMLNNIKKMNNNYNFLIDDFNNTNIFYPKNMFIMKINIFNEYCNFIFPLLLNLVNDFKQYSNLNIRCAAYCAEIITSMYLNKISEKFNILKIAIPQCYI